MLTSKQRAELRAQANGLDTTLIVGKDGVTGQVIAEALRQLDARELVKGKVLETSLLSAREACDAICESTGADGVQTLGAKFVIYLVNEKKRQAEAEKRRAEKAAAKQAEKERKAAERAAAKAAKEAEAEF